MVWIENQAAFVGFLSDEQKDCLKAEIDRWISRGKLSRERADSFTANDLLFFYVDHVVK